MKVTTLDIEIKAYVKSLRIERDGEIYRADLTYYEYEGYQLQFIDENERIASTPDWALEWEEDNKNSLEYELDYESGGWQFITKEQYEKEGE